jgi:hypothetical protein
MLLSGSGHRAVDAARAASLNFELGPELDDLSCRHAEKGGRALGIALQEGKQRFPPHPHPRGPNSPTETPLRTAAGNFGRIPRIYIELTQDRAVSWGAQKRMYQATPCERVLTIEASTPRTSPSRTSSPSRFLSPATIGSTPTPRQGRPYGA